MLAAGAATTESDVTLAALPFDRRRNGMIIGIGASSGWCSNPKMPYASAVCVDAELLATEQCNSAFHGTRLDVDHISAAVDK